MIKLRGDTELSQRMIEITTATRTKKTIQELGGGQWSFQTSVKMGRLKELAEEQGLQCQLQEKVEPVQVASR